MTRKKDVGNTVTATPRQHVVPLHHHQMLSVDSKLSYLSAIEKLSLTVKGDEIEF